MKFFGKSENHVPLMLLSLLLLALFQFFWLRKNWAEQKLNLKNQAESLFQRAVTNLQDSLIHASLEHRPDSPKLTLKNGDNRLNINVLDSSKVGIFALSDTLDCAPGSTFDFKIRQRKIETKSETIVTFRGDGGGDGFDSPGSPAKNNPSSSPRRIHLFITSEDSLDFKESAAPDVLVQRVLANPKSKFRSSEMVFNVENDSLDAGQLKSNFENLLKSASINLSPEVFPLRENDGTPPPENSKMSVGPVHAGIFSNRAYLAYLVDYQSFIAKKLLPHGLFSVLLFGITASAFWLVWQSLKTQKRLAELKNDLVSNITHELKTPVTTVGVALEALSDFEVLQNKELSKEYIEISKLELERLNLLIDKVLRSAQMEKTDFVLRFENLDFLELTRQIIKVLKPQFEQFGVAVHFESDAHQRFLVFADRLHLSGVVFNLLDNALKYRQKHAPEIWVRLERLPSGEIQLSVRDNGIGISEESQHKVFDKFFRAATGDTHDTKGHGLGLNYVANVVQRHRGKVWLQSVLGKGSTFFVKMPEAQK